MGGAPVRGDLLTYWQPDGPVSETARKQWIQNAERIATGLLELAHLPAFIDPRSYRVGFFCEGDVDLANAYVEHITAEQVEARQVSPPVPARLTGNCDDLPTDEVVLPCRPNAEDEEIVHAVLATMKASHALEFQVVIDEAQVQDAVSDSR